MFNCDDRTGGFGVCVSMGLVVSYIVHIYAETRYIENGVLNYCSKMSGRFEYIYEIFLYSQGLVCCLGVVMLLSRCDG